MLNIAYLRVLREKVLSDCRPDWDFWVCNGRVIHNIYELADSIENMNDENFRYHVNDDKQKNDFAKWIESVLEDGGLAHRLKKIRNKKEYANIIRARIKELEAI